jgi:hypothetical protein
LKSSYILKLKLFSIFICCIVIFSFTKDETKNNLKLKINWVEEFTQDFSFRNEWSYPLGIYRNQFDQLSCDGFCPREIDVMKDSVSRIIEDSLSVFYKLIDTTHINNSIKSDAWVYEYAGIDNIVFKKQKDGSILGFTSCNAETHSSLHIQIRHDSITSWISYNSIKPVDIEKFPLKSGDITFDKKLFNNGIIKAEFNFKFINTLNTKKEIFWNGIIYSTYK